MATSKLHTYVAESTGYAIKTDKINLFLKQAGVPFPSTKPNTVAKDLPTIVESNSKFVYLIKTE